ncbi:hypothetical protein [Micromonospora sp. b486]|uniref:hypothetical protein n=1 Tax=Micromonospora sp. b486 TaxID=3053986 RepID=UPI00259CBFD5|nr:hypothetical protein [Micromonospora sp. b486]MDM4778036.1 hypothetical protein [Micromonospora sp. b486]
MLRDPARALIDIGNRTEGELVRLNLGSFRPYLVTHPATCSTSCGTGGQLRAGR